MTQPVPNVVEAKVSAATMVSLVVSLLVAILNAVQNNSALLGSLPAWAQLVLIAVIPPLVTFAAGYATPSNRTGA